MPSGAARLAFGVLLAASLVGAVEPPEIADSDFRLADITARLLYEQTGNLSVDITDNDDFDAWNTVIGEGSAKENANDLLVSAVVKGPGSRNLAIPLTITVRTGRGKVLVSRKFASMLAETSTVRSILVPDVGCAGGLRLEARLGKTARTEDIALDCGE